MSRKTVSLRTLVALLALTLPMTGCGSAPGIVPDQSIFQADIVKAYQRVKVPAHKSRMIDSGIAVARGDFISVIAQGRIFLHDRYKPRFECLRIAVGDAFYDSALRGGVSGRTMTAQATGRVFLGISEGGFDPRSKRAYSPERYANNHGSLWVDIVVWSREDYAAMAAVVRKLVDIDAEYVGARDVLTQLQRLADVQQNQSKVLAEVAEAASELNRLQGRPVSDSPAGAKIQAAETGAQKTPPSSGSDSAESQDLLTAKSAQLDTAIEKLEALKAELQAARAKSEALAQQLETDSKEKKELLKRLDHLSENPPVVVVATPQPGSTVEVQVITINGVVEDDGGVRRVEILINGKPVKLGKGRRDALVPAGRPRRMEFKETIPLQEGENVITVRALDTEGLKGEGTIRITYAERRKLLWAVVVGVNNYPRVRPLKYAVNDARIFYSYLVDDIGVPPENVLLMLDGQATLSRLRSALGTYLKRNAGRDDLVMIFFAGHGAVERDSTSPDGDGLEKYILPCDVDPKDLYATALPMAEIARIFNRIRAERLLFIADACYSGAAGGRSIGIEGIRATLSDAFMERVSRGKGRVILSASGANEVSVELDQYGHGVFTYLLIKGLKGQADLDKDRYVTLDELYRYLSIYVPRMTQQEQHPVKKGSVEGRLVIGFVP